MARFDRIDPHPGHHAGADRDVARHDKQEVTGQEPPPHVESDVHYGKKFAETEAILRARAGRHGAPDEHLGSTEDQTTPTHGPPASGAVAGETGMPGTSPAPRPAGRRDRRGSGRIPAQEPPPPAEEPLGGRTASPETAPELIGAFQERVTRSLRAAREAARQLRTAGRELAGLPLDALRLAARVGRSWLGRSPRRP